MADGFQRSVLRVVREHGGLREIAPLLAKLPEALAARFPLDVVALLGAHVEVAYDANRTSVAVSTLAVRGYDFATSRAIHKKFTEDFPDFRPEVAMLSPREVLVETYGTITGELLATMLVDPDSQPILHTLMFRDIRGQVYMVERQCMTALFATNVPSARLARGLTSIFDTNGTRRTPVAATWELRESSVLSRPAAESHYYHATDGLRLPLLVPTYHEEDTARFLPYETDQEAAR